MYEVTTDGVWFGYRIYWTLKQPVTTLHSSLLHTLGLLSMSSLLLLRSGFQRWIFPFLWVPEWSLASATSFSQQQLTMTGPQQLSNSSLTLQLTDWLVLLITSWHGPCRKQRSSVAEQLLPRKHASLRSHYIVTALVELLISRLVPSNGSICHNNEEYLNYVSSIHLQRSIDIWRSVNWTLYTCLNFDVNIVS
jgi:hypothetical protein